MTDFNVDSGNCVDSYNYLMSESVQNRLIQEEKTPQVLLMSAVSDDVP